MKILAYLLAFNLLLSNTFPDKNSAELVKVFSLLEHWHHHQTETKISLFDYLILHYADQVHHNQDHEQHEDLPFHSHHQSQNAAYSFFLLPLLSLCYEQKTTFSDNIEQFSIYQSHFLPSFIADIWQPPKF